MTQHLWEESETWRFVDTQPPPQVRDGATIEDSVLNDEAARLFIVADGMGGQPLVT